MNRLIERSPVRFCTPFGDSVVLDGMLGGLGPSCSAFLVAGGPSLANLDLSLLSRRGVFTLAINNVWSMFRPNAWVFSDSPGSFCEQGWFDPGIMKFAPLQQKEGKIFRSVDGELRELTWKVGNMPNTWFYPRNSYFNPETFLTESTINWGQEDNQPDALGQKGGRSTMLAGLRLLALLGFQRIYLLGVDFRMQEGASNYAFEQARSASSVRGNNQSYEIQKVRLAALHPKFLEAGVEVYNCNPESELKAFPHRPYEQAIEESSSECGLPMQTAGRYDRQQRPMTRAGRRQHELKKYQQLARANPSYGATCHGRDAVPLVRSWHPKRVLDCGCGRNGFKKLLANQDIEVVGLDNAFEEADVSAPIYELPFRNGAFDAVTAFDVLEHLLPEDVELSLSEMARVGKGGRFCFSISYAPSRNQVNGEGLHMTVRNETWWLRQIRRVARTVDKHDRFIFGSFK